MTDLSPLYGNEHIKKILNGSGKFGTFLIEGPDGSGKHTLSRIIAASRLCSSDGEKKPCGKCVACKKVAAGMHLDLLSIDPALPVRELRESLDDIELYPADGARKVYIIDGADRLNEQKQNTLLKTLEEPPEFVTVILIARSSDALLQTVLSRCAVLSLRPLPDELLEKALREKIKEPDPTALHRAIMLSGGYIGQALEIYNKRDDALFERCEKFAAAFVLREWLEMTSLLTFAGKDARKKFTEYVSALEKYIKRCFGYAVAGSDEGLSETERALTSLGTEKLTKLCGAVGTTAENSNINVNLNLWSVYTVKKCREIR